MFSEWLLIYYSHVWLYNIPISNRKEDYSLSANEKLGHNEYGYVKAKQLAEQGLESWTFFKSRNSIDQQWVRNVLGNSGCQDLC